MIGKPISHYLTLSKLGEGGMGIVYKAEDTKLRRTVALKFLPQHAEEYRERFLREAQAAASLNHPNLCTIFEIDEEHGFIAMEFVEGPSLKDKIAARPLPLEEALDIAIQACTGLEAAHEKGIVHRDIKPSNLMLTAQGQVKIMDFGLAQINERTRITKAGASMGTPAYMSPEQAQGQPTDRRTDIWSIGVVLYEMLSGAVPFPGQTEAACTYSIVHTEPQPLTALRSGLSLDLDRIIAKALRKDPRDRYQNAADLMVDLRHLSGQPLAATGKKRAWKVIVPAAAVMALFTGSIAWMLLRPPQNHEPLRAIPLTTLTGVSRYPSFSPDGNHIAFSWTGSQRDNPDIYVQQIGAGSPLRITTEPSNEYNPAWSPDGRWIAFLRSRTEAGQNDLLLIPPLGGPQRKVAEIRLRDAAYVIPPHIAWCPDSSCLVVTDTTGENSPDALFVIPIETGVKTRLTHPQQPVRGDTNPAISHDGNWLVFSRKANLFAGELYLLPLRKDVSAAGEPRRLTPPVLDAIHPAWVPGSKEILFSAKGRLWRMSTSAGSEPVGLPFAGEDGIMPALSLRRTGIPSRLVYVRSFSDGNIWRINTSAPGVPASSPPVRAISSTRSEGMPQLSPDGSKVAFWSDRSGENEIWSSDLDGSNAIRLTSMPSGGTGYPHWSQDARFITYHSNAEGQGEVYVIPAGGGKARNLTTHPASDSFPSFSKDGNWIYFTSGRSGIDRVWKVQVTGGSAVPVTESVGYTPQESPEGGQLYYVDNFFAPGALWRMAISGGRSEKVIDGVLLGNFVVLEKGIYYMDRPSGERGVHYMDQPSGEAQLNYFDFATKRSVPIARNLGLAGGTPLSATADGRTILFGRTDSSVDDLMLVENFR
jgi:serine/threonine protein kinase